MKDLLEGFFITLRFMICFLFFLTCILLAGLKGLFIIGITIIAYNFIPGFKDAFGPILGLDKETRQFFICYFGTFAAFILLMASREIIWEHRTTVFTGFFLICLSFAFVTLFKFIKCIIGSSYTPTCSKTSNGSYYKLATFNDSLAKELMEIRADLIEIKINQDRQMVKEIGKELSPIDLGWPNAFIRLFRTYRCYPNSAICTTYRTQSKKTAGIIIIFDNIEFHSKFNARKLRKINSKKRNKIKLGQDLEVHFFDPDYNEHDIEENASAKILSIEWIDTCKVTLEIKPVCPHEPYDKKGESAAIIREIELYDFESRHFK